MIKSKINKSNLWLKKNLEIFNVHDLPKGKTSQAISYFSPEVLLWTSTPVQTAEAFASTELLWEKKNKESLYI